MFGLLNILVTWQPKMNREESAVFLRRSTLADIVMCLFVLLKNNRIGCAWGPMDHSELADLFITYRPRCTDKQVRLALSAAVNRWAVSVGRQSPYVWRASQAGILGRRRAIPLSLCDNGQVKTSLVWSWSSSRTDLPLKAPLFGVTAKQVLVSTGDVWLFHVFYIDV